MCVTLDHVRLRTIIPIGFCIGRRGESLKQKADCRGPSRESPNFEVCRLRLEAVREVLHSSDWISAAHQPEGLPLCGAVARSLHIRIQHRGRVGPSGALGLQSGRGSSEDGK